VLLISAKESADTFFIGFSGHIRVEMSNNLLTLIDGVGATKEQSEKCGTLEVFLTLTLGEYLLIKKMLI
jgi:hypothetical protein